MDNPDWFDPAPKKTIRIGFPKSLQYSLIWTLFFSIIGIAIQTLEFGNYIFPDIITDFFGKNYVAWFNSFGNFTSITLYGSYDSLVSSLITHWYYFFLTGGLISLIWAILSWIIHLEINFRFQSREDKLTKEKYLQIQQASRINSLIAEGMKALSENNKKQAETIYLQAKKEYKLELDPLRESYNSLVNFYQEILKFK